MRGVRAKCHDGGTPRQPISTRASLMRRVGWSGISPRVSRDEWVGALGQGTGGYGARGGAHGQDSQVSVLKAGGVHDIVVEGGKEGGVDGVDEGGDESPIVEKALSDAGRRSRSENLIAAELANERCAWRCDHSRKFLWRARHARSKGSY